MSETQWWKFVQRIAGDVPAKDIADRVGIDKSNVTRWKQGNNPAIPFVLKFARAYKTNVLHALVEAQILTPQEASTTEVPIGKTEAISQATDTELLSELMRRAENRE